MKIDRSFNTVVASAALGLLAVSGSAFADSHEATTTYKFGGYVKFDAMVSDYSDGTPDGNSLMRQFYYAPQIPVANPFGTTVDSDMTTDFQGRESRLNFRVDHKTAGGRSITAFVEMDFFTHSDGNEVVSNSYSPRLRHAFLKFDNWTFGQTWSTFQDVVALPEALDFVGPAESTTFIRQSMIRYTQGNLELAVENPQTFVAGGARDFTTVPDLIARYTFKLDGGSYVKLAGLVRSIKVGPDATDSQPDATGFGISASSKIVFDNGNDLRAMATYGDGVGRYIGLGFVPDGYAYVPDPLNSPAVDIDTAEALAWFVAYRMQWNDKWRSNIMYGSTSIDYDNDAIAAALGLNDSGSSIHFNVIHSVLPKLDVGFEVIWAEREANALVPTSPTDPTPVPGTTDGDFMRFMLSAKYAF